MTFTYDFDFGLWLGSLGQDRIDFQAHKKIVEGLLFFEERRLAEAGYKDLKEGFLNIDEY